jgi:tetratricopeptide (TPR) repeat protein
MQPTNSPIGILIWHIHHDQLIELLTEPLQNRIDYIKANKPEAEIPIRLKWLTPVQHPEKVPEEFVKAREAYDKAWEAYDKAREAYVKAWEAYDKAWEAYDKARGAYVKAREAYDKAQEAYVKAWEDYKPQIEALHREEHPGCPWNGRTLFGDKKV